MRKNYEQNVKILPNTISKEENGWVCDLYYPVAIAFSRAIELTLVEAIKNIILIREYF